MVKGLQLKLRYLAGNFLRCEKKAVLWLLRADQSPRLRTRFVPAILYRRVGVVLRALLVLLNDLSSRTRIDNRATRHAPCLEGDAPRAQYVRAVTRAPDAAEEL